MYAGDTHLTFAGRDPDLIQRNLNHDLFNISDWLVANKLTLNKSKTEFLVIVSRQKLRTLDRSPDLAIDNSPISQVVSTKSLGVHVDADLKKYIASGIGALRRCRPFVPLETLICAYNSIIEPHYDYCDIVWNNCGATNATKLQKLQNRAARILTYSDYDAEVEPLFQQLNWTQLARRRELHTVNIIKVQKFNKRPGRLIEQIR